MVEEVVGGEEGLERGEGVSDTKYLDLDTFWKCLERRIMEHGECALLCTIQHRLEHTHPQEKRVFCTIFRKIN